jgi:hypothetical protein
MPDLPSFLPSTFWMHTDFICSAPIIYMQSIFFPEKVYIGDEEGPKLARGGTT